MKKRTILLGFIIFILSIQLCSAFSFMQLLAPTTGKATSDSVVVSLQMLPDTFVNIIKPVNGTYLTNISLPLEFTSQNIYALSYGLDNGPNTSIVSNISFNTSEGIHNLSLFGIGIYRNKSDFVFFSVNLSKFFIIYNNYQGAYKGNSTNFYYFSYEELQNFSDMTLEDTRYGKIVWTVPVNLTNSPSNTVNLDLYTNMSFNHIYVDAGYFSNLNRDINLFMYNLTFQNPIIMRNGLECSSCSLISYSNGVLMFNTTNFAQSVFSAKESPVSSTGARAPSGAGAAGAGTTPTPSIPAPPKEVKCVENWTCSEWSNCSSGLQRRKCVDNNNCGSEWDRPSTALQCGPIVEVIKIASIISYVLASIAIVIAAWKLYFGARTVMEKELAGLLENGYSNLKKRNKKQAVASYKQFKARIKKYRKEISRKNYESLQRQAGALDAEIHGRKYEEDLSLVMVSE